MGPKLNTIQRVDPSHIFTSPDQVRNQLLQTMYRYSITRLEVLRALFLSKATRTDGLETAYWTKDTFIDHLVEMNPAASTETRRAGPLLYKMMLRYGSFPFTVNEGRRLTCEVFLSGIAMQSHLGLHVLWKDHGTINDIPKTRPRAPVDDVRIFFQSIADGNLCQLDSPHLRSVNDDEDLLDVLVAAMRLGYGRRNLKTSYTRQDVLDAATALPSSLSRNLEGSISLEDLRSLFELIVALTNGLWGSVLQPTSAVTDCLLESFTRRLNGKTEVDWETFHHVVLGAFPNLLATLFAFIETTFHLTRDFWLEPDLLPKSPRVQEVISRSRIITPERLIQFLLIMPKGLALHFEDITFLETLNPENVEDMTTLLKDPGRLLVMKCSNHFQTASNREFNILCVYTGTPDKYGYHFLEPRAWRDSCIVFSLCPAHSVYHPTRESEMDSRLEIREEPRRVSLSVGALKMYFTDGLHVLNMETAGFNLKSNIEALEIWML